MRLIEVPAPEGFGYIRIKDNEVFCHRCSSTAPAEAKVCPSCHAAITDPGGRVWVWEDGHGDIEG